MECRNFEDLEDWERDLLDLFLTNDSTNHELGRELAQSKGLDLKLFLTSLGYGCIDGYVDCCCGFDGAKKIYNFEHIRLIDYRLEPLFGRVVVVKMPKTLILPNKIKSIQVSFGYEDTKFPALICKDETLKEFEFEELYYGALVFTNYAFDAYMRNTEWFLPKSVNFVVIRGLGTFHRCLTDPKIDDFLEKDGFIADEIDDKIFYRK